MPRIFALTVVLFLMHAVSHAAVLLPPTITAAAIDHNGDLVIVGDRFGGGVAVPNVWLGGVALRVLSAADEEIRAAVPDGIDPGSYAVVVQRNTSLKLPS